MRFGKCSKNLNDQILEIFKESKNHEELFEGTNQSSKEDK